MRSIRGVLLVFAFVGLVHADALVVTRAMKASTICEAFLEPGRIEIELEIGAADLEAFRNILPDDLYTKLGHPRRPIEERMGLFFMRDWVVKADGELLVPQVQEMRAAKRIDRDEVTGEPVGESEETVLLLALRYPFPGRPEEITFAPPTGETGVAANVGFVVYHAGLPVNDFRHLSREETLRPDWDDPWFSAFENRNLKRQYASPIQAFVYVDPFEVRKEIICRPRDLEPWLDLELGDTIEAGQRAEVERRVAEFLSDRNPVTIDGKPVDGQLDRIHFVRRTLRTTGVVPPDEDIDAVGATMGVIFVYPIQALPQQVTMRWELFSDRVPSIPAVATDEAGGMPSLLTADDPDLVWRNFLKNPTLPTFAEIAPPSQGSPLLRWGTVGVCCLLAVLLFFRRRRLLALVPAAGAVAVLVAVPDGPHPDDADAILAGLLRNVYRAFDYRGEEVIYDTLARSASGDLLRQVYLETQRALELRNQGGARTRVQAVELVESDTVSTAAGIQARCVWNVAGSVGHWGHIHQRANQYEAAIVVEPVDGVWKITGLELLSERRL
jgi:hypothetical protein